MSQPTARDRSTRTLLFVTNAFSYGGSEKHLLELLDRIEDRNVRSVILCLDSDPFSERLKENVRSRVSVRTEKSLKSVGDWRRIFQEINPDAVVLIYGTLWLLPWFAALGARLAGVRRIFAIYHLMPEAPRDLPVVEVKSARDVVRRLVGRRARRVFSARVPPYICDQTICVSNAVRDALVRQYRFPARKMRTIHNGISLREFVPGRNQGNEIRTRLGISPDEFLLVCTARLSTEKGIDILLSAMSRLIREQPSCKCIIVGEGYLKEKLIDQIESLGLKRHVFLDGFQSDVRPYLKSADAFVLTSHIEGLPFSVLEAMACGLPCIVTNVGGNAEAVIDTVNGFVVSPGSVDEVVRAISEMLTHRAAVARMGQASRERACKEFDIESRMSEIRDLILT